VQRPVAAPGGSARWQRPVAAYGGHTPSSEPPTLASGPWCRPDVTAPDMYFLGVLQAGCRADRLRRCDVRRPASRPMHGPAPRGPADFPALDKPIHPGLPSRPPQRVLHAGGRIVNARAGQHAPMSRKFQMRFPRTIVQLALHLSPLPTIVRQTLSNAGLVLGRVRHDAIEFSAAVCSVVRRAGGCAAPRRPVAAGLARR
jgi:hypothetical protein